MRHRPTDHTPREDASFDTPESWEHSRHPRHAIPPETPTPSVTPLNSFFATPEETLPPPLHRNWAGFLTRPPKVLHHSTLDPNALSHEVLYLQDNAILVCFIGGKIHDSLRLTWLTDLDRLLYPNCILLHKATGNRFHYVKVDSSLAVDKAIALLLHKFPGGEATYHR